MQQISATRRGTYLTALSQEIQKKLQRAEETPAQRGNLWQELFADVALEVDDRAKVCFISKFYKSRDQVAPLLLSFSVVRCVKFDERLDGGMLILLSPWAIWICRRYSWYLRRGTDSISPAKDGSEDHLCFYDVLSSHFVQVPEDGQCILDLIVKLWSQSFASQIFVLLFHKWLFEVVIADSEKLLRYSSALVQGSANVFWIDIQTNTRRFQSIFHYLLEDVALDQSRLTKLVLQAQRDLFLLLSRYIFFYNAVDKLAAFLNKFPPFPNSFLVGGPADLFVIELTDQLQKLKVEPVVLHYLSQIKDLQGLELRMTTCTRLKTCLYSFTSPGGPMYPTRAVRHAARDALDALFPVGQYPRHLISLFFRLLYPWYWPSSCWYFVISCIKALFYSLVGLIVSSWEALRGRKMPKRDM